jgi:hypothetical protein
MRTSMFKRFIFSLVIVLGMSYSGYSQVAFLSNNRASVERHMAKTRKPENCKGTVAYSKWVKGYTVIKYNLDAFDTENYWYYNSSGVLDVLVIGYDDYKDASRTLNILTLEYDDVEILKVDQGVVFLTKEYIYFINLYNSAGKVYLIYANATVDVSLLLENICKVL